MTNPKYVVFTGSVTLSQEDERMPETWTIRAAGNNRERLEHEFHIQVEMSMEDCIGLAFVFRKPNGDCLVSKLIAWSGLLPLEGVDMIHLGDNGLEHLLLEAEPEPE